MTNLNPVQFYGKSTTTTTTIDPPKKGSYRLILKNTNEEFNSEEVLNKLLIIVNEYILLEDLLSIKLLHWADRVITILPTKDSSSEKIAPNELLKKVESAVDDLFKNILVSVLKNPLKEPVLDGKYTWDKPELDEYREKMEPQGLFSCPITGKPLNYHVIINSPHYFAVEILKLAHSLPFEPVQETSQALIVPQNNKHLKTIVPINHPENNINHYEIDRQLGLYLACGDMARNEFRDYKLAHTFKKETMNMKVFKEKIKEYVEWQAECSKRHAERQAEIVLAEIDSANKSHATTVNVMNGRIQDRDNTIHITKEKLASTEKTVAAQASQINSQAATISNLSSQLQQVRNQANKRDNGCTLF